MKFLVPNYSCLQNPWLGGYCPQIPVLSVLCPQLNLLNPPEQNSWVRHCVSLAVCSSDHNISQIISLSRSFRRSCSIHRHGEGILLWWTLIWQYGGNTRRYFFVHKLNQIEKNLSSLRLQLCAVTVTGVTQTSLCLRSYWILRSVGWSFSYRSFGIIYRLHIQRPSSLMRKLHSGRRLKSRKYILRLKTVSLFLNHSSLGSYVV